MWPSHPVWRGWGMQQSKQELLDRVASIAEIFSTILNDTTVYNSLGSDKQKQLTTGINKAYGQAIAFMHEYASTARAQKKNRKVITQDYADVTQGVADALFAKSSELKSVTKPEKGAVDKVIRDALGQLAGLTGTTPRDHDVRIVDIRIDGSDNPWPFPGGAYGTPRDCTTASKLIQAANQRLDEVTGDSGHTGAFKLNTWLDGQTYPDKPGLKLGTLRTHSVPDPKAPWLSNQTIRPNPNSTRPVYETIDSRVFGQAPSKIRCLTVKIRYATGYRISDYNEYHTVPDFDQFGKLSWKKVLVGQSVVTELVYQRFKYPNGKIQSKIVKVKREHRTVQGLTTQQRHYL